MPARYIALVAAALSLMIAIPLKTFAEDAAKPSPAQIADGQSKAGVANALIILGRSAKDPDMLMTGTSTPSLRKPIATPATAPASRPRTITRGSATTNIGATA
jgi:hypothetical protein